MTEQERTARRLETRLSVYDHVGYGDVLHHASYLTIHARTDLDDESVRVVHGDGSVARIDHTGIFWVIPHREC